MTGTAKCLSRASKGYTLIELLIALAVFTIIIVMIAGLISRLVLIERRNIAEQAMQEDIRFAFEIFSRETRLAFASTFALADSSGSSVVMRNQNGACVNYRLRNGVFERAEVNAGGADCTGASFGDRYAPLTSNRIKIERLRFDLPDSVFNQRDNRLDRQGFITLMLQAKGASAPTPPLDLQTTVTSRQVNVYEPR